MNLIEITSSVTLYLRSRDIACISFPLVPLEVWIGKALNTFWNFDFPLFSWTQSWVEHSQLSSLSLFSLTTNYLNASYILRCLDWDVEWSISWVEISCTWFSLRRAHMKVLKSMKNHQVLKFQWNFLSLSSHDFVPYDFSLYMTW